MIEKRKEEIRKEEKQEGRLHSWVDEGMNGGETKH